MGKYRRSLLRTSIWLCLFCLPVSAFSADKVTLQLIWKNQFQFAGYYVAKKRADLKEVADLKDKRIMVTDDVVGMASLTAMLAGNGIKPDDYTSQKHTFTVDDLISGDTDAIAAYISNEPYHMQKQGMDYTIFAPKNHGFDFYSDILFTSQKLYKDNPQLVERFNQASLRGWEYAFGHIDEAVDIILKKYNTQNRDKEALQFEAGALKKLAYDRDTSLGLITKGRVEQISQVYRLLGFTIKPLKMDDLLYDQEARARLYLTPEEQFYQPLPQDHRIYLCAQRQSNHFKFYGLERYNHRGGKRLYH